jgi:flagellar biosynthesis GTPase FlhF
MSELDKMFARKNSQAKNQMFFDQMSKRELNKLNKMFRRAKPKRWDELTEAERKAYEKEQAQYHQEWKEEQRRHEIREFLQIGIDIKSDDPNSELFRTAKELLDIFDRTETERLSGSEKKRFSTGLDRYVALLKAECKSKEKLAEPDSQQGKIGFLGELTPEDPSES